MPYPEFDPNAIMASPEFQKAANKLAEGDPSKLVSVRKYLLGKLQQRYSEDKRMAAKIPFGGQPTLSRSMGDVLAGRPATPPAAGPNLNDIAARTQVPTAPIDAGAELMPHTSVNYQRLLQGLRDGMDNQSALIAATERRVLPREVVTDISAGVPLRAAMSAFEKKRTLTGPSEAERMAAFGAALPVERPTFGGDSFTAEGIRPSDPGYYKPNLPNAEPGYAESDVNAILNPAAPVSPEYAAARKRALNMLRRQVHGEEVDRTQRIADADTLRKEQKTARDIQAGIGEIDKVNIKALMAEAQKNLKKAGVNTESDLTPEQKRTQAVIDKLGMREELKNLNPDQPIDTQEIIAQKLQERGVSDNTAKALEKTFSTLTELPRFSEDDMMTFQRPNSGEKVLELVQSGKPIDTLLKVLDNQIGYRSKFAARGSSILPLMPSYEKYLEKILYGSTMQGDHLMKKQIYPAIDRMIDTVMNGGYYPIEVISAWNKVAEKVLDEYPDRAKADIQNRIQDRIRYYYSALISGKIPSALTKTSDAVENILNPKKQNA